MKMTKEQMVEEFNEAFRLKEQLAGVLTTLADDARRRDQSQVAAPYPGPSWLTFVEDVEDLEKTLGELWDGLPSPEDL